MSIYASDKLKSSSCTIVGTTKVDGDDQKIDA